MYLPRDICLLEHQGKGARDKYTCIISDAGSPIELHVIFLQSGEENKYTFPAQDNILMILDQRL
jgi:hypothetical protein